MSQRNIVRPFGYLGAQYRVNDFGLWCQRLAWLLAFGMVPLLAFALVQFRSTPQWVVIAGVAAVMLPVVGLLVMLAVRNGERLPRA